jgi:SAM-dependent methyltransferase
MQTKIIPEAVLDLVKRSPYVYVPARKLRMGVGRVVPPRRVPGVRGRVHFNDFMLDGTSPAAVARYKEGAENVVALIERSLGESGRTWDDIGSWLDFGCGYGRVVRVLVERVDPERIYVTDVIDEGVSFCAREFGVRPLPSSPELGSLELPEVELAYAISVLTHLPEESGREFLRVLGKAIAPGGIFLFTTHGRWSLEHAESYSKAYGGDAKRSLADEVRARGVGYIPYRHYFGDDYGMAWHSKEYVLDAMTALHGRRFELLFHEPAGLDEHQDVFAFRRVG